MKQVRDVQCDAEHLRLDTYTPRSLRTLSLAPDTQNAWTPTTPLHPKTSARLKVTRLLGARLKVTYSASREGSE